MKRSAVGDKDSYPCRPRQLNPLSWFYERKSGIDVLIQSDEHTNAIQARLSWRRLEAAVDNHRRVLRRRKRKNVV